MVVVDEYWRVHRLTEVTGLRDGVRRSTLDLCSWSDTEPLHDSCTQRWTSLEGHKHVVFETKDVPDTGDVSP